MYPTTVAFQSSCFYREDPDWQIGLIDLILTKHVLDITNHLKRLL